MAREKVGLKMTNGKRNLKQNFIRFVVPSVVAQWVFALYTMVDGIFVARGVGETALAAVNLSQPFVNFIFALSLILAVGTSTIVSIHYGQGDTEKANRAYSQNILVVGIFSLVLAGLVLLNLGTIASFLGAEGNTLNYVKTYVGTVAAFAPCFAFAYYFEILIKADGKPKLATIMVITGAVLNCILDYLMVFVLHWGVFGAAFATGLSQLTVTVFFVSYFLGKKARLRLCRFRFSLGSLQRTIRLGLPSGITDFSAALMIFFFNHAILAYIGQEAIVSYTIVAYVNTILVMSLSGVAQGMQPLASYSYGKGDIKNCNRLLRYSLVTTAGITLVILVSTWLGAPAIVSIFIEPEKTALRQYSVDVFRIFSLSFLPVGFSVVTSGWFAAIEKARAATAVSVARGFLFLLLSLWGLIQLFGGQSIWWAPLLSETLCAVLCGLFLVYILKSASSGTHPKNLVGRIEPQLQPVRQKKP